MATNVPRTTAPDATAPDAVAPDAVASRPQSAVPVRELTPEDVRAELWPRPAPTFVPMTAEERAALGEIVAALARIAMTGGDLHPLAARAHDIGFCIEIWRVHGRVFWALREQPEQRRGAGAYVLRPGPRLQGAAEIVLQAPHAYFDRGTGNLAAALFFGHEGRGRARALFTNTAHRHRGSSQAAPTDAQPEHEQPRREQPEVSADAPKPRVSADAPKPRVSADAPKPRVSADAPKPKGPADVAHSAVHGFQVATEGIVRVLDQLVVIQLHGFSDRPDQPQIILSSGVDHAPAHITALATALGAVFARVLRYPDDIDELGGTSNVQGRMLARYPHAHFVHVELSGTTRWQLGRTPALLAGFAHALLSLDTASGMSSEPDTASDTGTDPR